MGSKPTVCEKIKSMPANQAEFDGKFSFYIIQSMSTIVEDEVMNPSTTMQLKSSKLSTLMLFAKGNHLKERQASLMSQSLRRTGPNKKFSQKKEVMAHLETKKLNVK